MLYLLVGVVSMQAQNNAQDSLCNPALPCGSDRVYNLKLKEVLIPTAIVGASALYVGNKWLTKQRDNVQDAFSAKGRNKISMDEYSQYAPMVAVYGLNLFGIKGKHFLKTGQSFLPCLMQQWGLLSML